MQTCISFLLCFKLAGVEKQINFIGNTVLAVVGNEFVSGILKSDPGNGLYENIFAG